MDEHAGAPDGIESGGHVAAHEEAMLDEEEEEEECRVCRGPAEEGRPLFSPCKCSGSIGLTHQDCLTSWLEVTRGGGKCELCSHKFTFAPKYADGAPDHLPPVEVLAGLTRRAAVRWLPYAVRALVAASLWLCVLPLATAYLYQGWMHRPSSIMTRWKLELLAGDAVSGAVIAAVIIVSFLSLMSFADFLRFHWQQDQQGGGEGREEQEVVVEEEEEAQEDRDDLPGQFEVGENALLPRVDGGIDNGFLENDDEHIERIRDRIERRRHRRAERVEEEEEELPRLGDAAAPEPERERMPHIPLPHLDRNAVGVMDQRELFFPQGVERAELRENQRDNGRGQEERHDGEEDLLHDPLRADRENRRREILAAAALRRQTQRDDDGDGQDGVDGDDELMRNRPRQPLNAEIQHDPAQHLEVDDERNDMRLIIDPEEEIENMMRAQEEERQNDDEEQLPQGRQDIIPERGANAPQNDGRDENNNRFEPQFEPLDPVFDQDEAMDVEFQIALDELLGFRGPFGALIRNMLWLLAFNTTYLGLFAFIPHTIGSMTAKSTALAFLAEFLSRPFRYLRVEELIGVNTTNLSYAINATAINATGATNAKSAYGTGFFMGHIVHELNAESRRHNTILLLPDVATVVLGYLSMAMLVFLWYTVLSLCRKLRKNNDQHQPAEDSASTNDGAGRPEERDGRDHHARQRVLMGNLDEIQMAGNEWDGGELDPAMPPQVDVRNAIAEKLSLGVDCAVAIVKVGILLFLKMLLLPLLLGFWLDVATLPLFASTIHDRAQQAGADFFGSILLHWVMGITFMLLVTVSVLQLREVAHPDLLARVIRPQEPQPDLLGNLLQENGVTHARRMLLSLLIYAALLSIHIWLPAKLLVSSGISQFFPIFRPKFWHIVLPQLQVPIELLIFHLTMLALLEKYKNYIGQMQHMWLTYMCRLMGLTDFILPRDVDKFVLVGSKPMFLRKSGDSNEDNGGYTATVVQDEDTVTDATSASSMDEDGGKIPPIEDPLVKKLVKNRRHEIGFSEQPGLVLDPFWDDLYAMHEKGESTDDFIRANLYEVTSQQSAPSYKSGTVTREGKRVLDASQSHLRLSLPSATNGSSRALSESAMTGGRSGAIGAENAIVLPTSIGAYRICVRESAGNLNGKNNSTVIEFWREVPGNLIPRPPEGWDDLGVGGAEVQGRWAWGKERKAEVEEGVAQRLSFIPSSDGTILSKLKRYAKAALLVLKLAVLLMLSWLAVLVTVCCIISAPLSAGRFIFFLLQIPDRCFHDPAAYAVGGAVIFPAVFKLSEHIGGKEDGRPWKWVWDWASSFRLPGLRKIRTLLQAAFLWLGLVPFLIGMVYHLCLVKTPSFWTGKEPLLDARTFVLAWGVGGLFLNVWAALCYICAFRREFWLRIAFGGDEAGAMVAVVANAANDGVANDEGVEDPKSREGSSQNDSALHPQMKIPWQGKDGRIARYFRTMCAVLANWEWDKVDRVTLLEECATPITRQTIILFLGPVLAYLGWLALLCIFTGGGGGAGLMLPFIGLIEEGLYRRLIFRCFVMSIISIQLGLAFQSPLQRWFCAAHKAARDDRYLIGEILLDYVQPAGITKTPTENHK